jgi:hypothetical protein
MLFLNFYKFFMKKPISILIFFLAFISCKPERAFKNAKDISEYPKTDFVVALEQEMPKSKNIIYASSLLYAWDSFSFKNINTKNCSNDFLLLNSSKSFQNSLDENEINIETSFDDDKVIAKSFFNKSLPFKLALEHFDEALNFEGVKVANFGFYGYNYEMSSIAEILYYKNDNDFILKLNSKELDHEIIILKFEDQSFKNLSAIINEVKNKSLVGAKELKNQKKSWKYQFLDEDELKIPIINFNLEKSYHNLIGNKFSVNGKRVEITEAYQRIAFILDEKGAEVESESEFGLVMEEDPDKPKPKNFILNKPFAIILKRKKSKNPYFVCWIDNSELMVKK